MNLTILPSLLPTLMKEEKRHNVLTKLKWKSIRYISGGEETLIGAKMKKESRNWRIKCHR